MEGDGEEEEEKSRVPIRRIKNAWLISDRDFQTLIRFGIHLTF